MYYAQQNFEKAFYYFQQVVGLVGNADEGRRARLGLMRCAKALDRVPVVLQYAESLLQDEGLPSDWRSEALLNAARSAMKLSDSASAKMYYEEIAEKIQGEAQVESNYYLAQLDYVQSNFETSNERVFWIIDNLPTYTQWRWKILLLMAKNYAGLQDDFQANYTLDFIIENGTEDAVSEALEFKTKLSRKETIENIQDEVSDSLRVNEANAEEYKKLD